MEPIYNRNGRVVAWQNNDVIHDLRGEAVAFLSGSNVVNYRGQHLGVLDRGFFRDHNGSAVTFIRGAIGGPVPPVPSVPPVPPVPAIAPVRPVPPVPPVPAVPSLGWSSMDWDRFVSR